MTWQARTNRGLGGTGFARYYRRYDNLANGTGKGWNRAAMVFSPISGTGFTERLGAATLEYMHAQATMSTC